MTVAKKYFNWQKAGAPTPEYSTKSPNLVQIMGYLRATYGMTNLGIYNRRPVRGGTAWSTHAFGAALDAAYTDRAQLEWVILPWLIKHSEELGIQRIHDYTGNRYWQAGKGMVDKSPGVGADWLHIETHPSQWGNTIPVGERIKA